MSKKIKIKHGWNTMRYTMSYLLLGFYLVVACLFLFTDAWKDLIPTGRGLIGLILLLFGSFRFYVAYRRYTSKKIRIHSSTKKEKVNAE